MLLIPKPTRKPKPRKPLKRSRKPIASKAVFKAQTNPLKVYRSKRPLADIRAFAARCQQERLANPTPAEDRMRDLLQGLGVDFKREFVMFYANDTRFVILDFWLPAHRLAIELDGKIHDRQKRYDAGRDAFLKSHGVRTIRFTNAMVLRKAGEVRNTVIAVLSG